MQNISLQKNSNHVALLVRVCDLVVTPLVLTLRPNLEKQVKFVKNKKLHFVCSC